MIEANSQQRRTILELRQDVYELRTLGPVSVEESKCRERELETNKSALKAYGKEIDRLHADLQAAMERDDVLECKKLIKTQQSDRTAWHEAETSLEKTIDDQRQNIQQRDIDLEKALNEIKVKTQDCCAIEAKNNLLTTDIALFEEHNRVAEIETQILKAENSNLVKENHSQEIAIAELAMSRNILAKQKKTASQVKIKLEAQITKINKDLRDISWECHSLEIEFVKYKEWCERTHINKDTQGKQDSAIVHMETQPSSGMAVTTTQADNLTMPGSASNTVKQSDTPGESRDNNNVQDQVDVPGRSENSGIELDIKSSADTFDVQNPPLGSNRIEQSENSTPKEAKEHLAADIVPTSSSSIHPAMEVSSVLPLGSASTEQSKRTTKDSPILPLESVETEQSRETTEVGFVIPLGSVNTEQSRQTAEGSLALPLGSVKAEQSKKATEDSSVPPLGSVDTEQSVQTTQDSPGLPLESVDIDQSKETSQNGSSLPLELVEAKQSRQDRQKAASRNSGQSTWTRSVNEHGQDIFIERFRKKTSKSPLESRFRDQSEREVNIVFEEDEQRSAVVGTTAPAEGSLEKHSEQDPFQGLEQSQEDFDDLYDDERDPKWKKHSVTRASDSQSQIISHISTRPFDRPTTAGHSSVDQANVEKSMVDVDTEMEMEDGIFSAGPEHISIADPSLVADLMDTDEHQPVGCLEQQSQVIMYPQGSSTDEMNISIDPIRNNFSPIVNSMPPSTFDTDKQDDLEKLSNLLWRLKIDDSDLPITQESQSNLASRSLENGVGLDDSLPSAPDVEMGAGFHIDDNLEREHGLKSRTYPLSSQDLASTTVPMEMDLSVAPTNNLPGLIFLSSSINSQQQAFTSASDQGSIYNPFRGEIGPDEWKEATKEYQEIEEDMGDVGPLSSDVDAVMDDEECSPFPKNTSITAALPAGLEDYNPDPRDNPFLETSGEAYDIWDQSYEEYQAELHGDASQAMRSAGPTSYEMPRTQVSQISVLDFRAAQPFLLSPSYTASSLPQADHTTQQQVLNSPSYVLPGQSQTGSRLQQSRGNFLAPQAIPSTYSHPSSPTYSPSWTPTASGPVRSTISSYTPGRQLSPATHPSTSRHGPGPSPLQYLASSQPTWSRNTVPQIPIIGFPDNDPDLESDTDSDEDDEGDNDKSKSKSKGYDHRPMGSGEKRKKDDDDDNHETGQLRPATSTITSRASFSSNLGTVFPDAADGPESPRETNKSARTSMSQSVPRRVHFANQQEVPEDEDDDEDAEFVDVLDEATMRDIRRRHRMEAGTLADDRVIARRPIKMPKGKGRAQGQSQASGGSKAAGPSEDLILDLGPAPSVTKRRFGQES